MKRNSLILIFSLFSIMAFSQVNKENEKRARELQASDEYICGLGHGNTLKQASNDALAALSSQISTTVSSDFNYLVNSESNGDDVKESVKVDNIIRTYSHTTLRNAMELVIEDEPNATVLRYIKKSELDKIFEQRRNKVLEYASNAQKYEKENKVADALSSYYASLALLRSLPDGSDMKIRLGFTEETLLMPLIMNNVNEILNNVEIKTEAIEDDGDERTMVINIQYKGKPAANFNYTYYNGSSRSDVYSAKDGTGDITIPKGMSLSKLDIHAEYICEDEANYDRELRDVLDNTTPVPFRTAKMKLAKDKEVKAVAANVNTATATVMSAPAASATSTTMDDSKVSPYLDTMQKIELAIRQKSYESIRDCFTAEGYDMFNKLVNYGKAKLLRSPVLQF